MSFATEYDTDIPNQLLKGHVILLLVRKIRVTLPQKKSGHIAFANLDWQNLDPAAKNFLIHRNINLSLNPW